MNFPDLSLLALNGTNIYRMNVTCPSVIYFFVTLEELLHILITDYVNKFVQKATLKTPLYAVKNVV